MSLAQFVRPVATVTSAVREWFKEFNLRNLFTIYNNICR